MDNEKKLQMLYLMLLSAALYRKSHPGKETPAVSPKDPLLIGTEKKGA